MTDARELAQRIANELAEADEYGNPEYTWYGYVSLADVRELVGLVLAEPLPQEASET
jgi:hypothetical protein